MFQRSHDYVRPRRGDFILGCAISTTNWGALCHSAQGFWDPKKAAAQVYSRELKIIEEAQQQQLHAKTAAKTAVIAVLIIAASVLLLSGAGVGYYLACPLVIGVRRALLRY